MIIQPLEWSTTLENMKIDENRLHMFEGKMF